MMWLGTVLHTAVNHLVGESPLPCHRFGYGGMLKHRTRPLGLSFQISWPLIFTLTVVLVVLHVQLLVTGHHASVVYLLFAMVVSVYRAGRNFQLTYTRRSEEICGQSLADSGFEIVGF